MAVNLKQKLVAVQTELDKLQKVVSQPHMLACKTALASLANAAGMDEDGQEPRGTSSGGSCASVAAQDLVDAVIELQNAFSQAQGQAEQVVNLCKLVVAIVNDIVQAATDTDKQLIMYGILSEYRDYVRAFRTAIVKYLNKLNWDTLSLELILEEDKPEDKQPVTTAVKTALAAIDFSWEEWCELQDVADASVRLFHTGEKQKLGLKKALAKLKTGIVPANLLHTFKAMAKAIQYLIEL